MSDESAEKTTKAEDKRKAERAEAQRKRDAAWRNKDKAFLKKEPRHF